MSVSDRDLAIGGAGATGLSLDRSYNSGVAGASLGPGINWSFSVDGYVSIEPLPIPPDTDPPPRPGSEPYIYNVILGSKSVGFLGGSGYTGPSGSHTGGPVGTYQPALPSGAQLVYNGTNPATGYYTFTDSDGTVINFQTGANSRIVNWTMPDGTRLDYTYTSSNNLRAIISNRGWALLFESATKVCAVNMAQTYVTNTSTCPSDAQTVTYGTTAGTFNTGSQLLTSVTKSGKTTDYSYNSKDHLSCVKEPGQSVCKITTTYTECVNDPMVFGIQYDRHLHDYVSSQIDAGGKTYSFTYSDLGSGYGATCPKWQDDTNLDYRSFSSSTASMTENGAATTNVSLDPSGLPNTVTDPLSRATSFSHSWVAGPMGTYVQDATVQGVTWPEGNNEGYLFDARGNMTSKTVMAKSGSSLSNIVVSAAYPSSCTNVTTCNKPSYTIDARGNRADYTYDSAHGGVLTATGPADANGVRPVKRYAYAQRYAWIKTNTGGYTQTASPVWLLVSEKTCRTSATVSGACAGGSSDEVVKTYEYGPDTGLVGNNLLLRGVAVTADGLTLRTCYGYDRDGNKIFETKPRANLTVCS